MVGALIILASVTAYETATVADNEWGGWSYSGNAPNSNSSDYGGTNAWSGGGSTAIPWVSGTLPITAAGNYRFAIRWRTWNQNNNAAQWHIKVNGQEVRGGVINQRLAVTGDVTEDGKTFEYLGQPLEIVAGDTVVFELDDNSGGYTSFDALWYAREVDVTSGTGTRGTVGAHVSGFLWEEPWVDPDLYPAPLELWHTPNYILPSLVGAATGADTRWVIVEVGCLGVDNTTGAAFPSGQSWSLTSAAYRIEVGRNGGIEVQPYAGTYAQNPFHPDMLAYLLEQPEEDFVRPASSYFDGVDHHHEVRHIVTFLRQIHSSMINNDIDWSSIIPRGPGAELDGADFFGTPSQDGNLDGTPDDEEFTEEPYDLDDLKDELNHLESSVLNQTTSFGFDPATLAKTDHVFSVPIPVPGQSLGSTTYAMSTFLTGAQSRTGISLDPIRVVMRGFLLVMLSLSMITKVVNTLRAW